MSAPDRTIFVIGPPRCGSTLVYNIICSANEANPALAENRLLAHLSSAYEFSLRRLAIEQGHFFINEQDVKNLLRVYVNLFLDKIRERYPHVKVLVLKSISLSTTAPFLAELLPNAQFCICIRDPRDIICSMIEVGQKQQSMGLANQYPRDIKILATKLLSSYEPCLRNPSKEFRNRSFIVKYESIVSNPADSIKDMSRKTGLDLSDFNPNIDWQKNNTDIDAMKKSGDPYVTEYWGKGISLQSVGGYKTKLSSEEIVIIETICKPLFDLFNYQINR